MKIVILFALLFCNTVTINSDTNLATGLIIGSAISSGNRTRNQAIAPVENAVMLRLRACPDYHKPLSYSTTTGMIQVLVKKGSGCEDSKYKELSIHDFLSSKFPNYKSYSIQSGRREIFIFVVP